MKRTLFYSVLLLTFQLSLSTFLFAQDKEEINLAGKYALLFQIGSNFSLNNFESATIAGKYQLNQKSSIRLSLSLNMNNQDADNIIKNEGDLSSSQSKENISDDRFGYRIDAQYLCNTFIIEDLSFYFGGGPFVGYSSNNSENKKDPYYSNTTRIISVDYNSLNTGIGITTGVEWFVKSNISLLADYSLDFGYDKTTRNTIEEYFGDQTSKTTSENSTSSFYIGNSYAKLGVSFYF
jgi:hypothetical protein